MPVLNSREIRATQVRGTVGLPPTARRTSAPTQRQPVAQKEALQKEEEGKTTYYIGDAEITEQEYKKYGSMGDREKFDFLVSKKAIPEGSEYIPPLTQSEVDYANKARQEAIDSGFLPTDTPKVEEARSWAYLSPEQVKEQKEYRKELQEWAGKFVKQSEAKATIMPKLKDYKLGDGYDIQSALKNKAVTKAELLTVGFKQSDIDGTPPTYQKTELKDTRIGGHEIDELEDYKRGNGYDLGEYLRDNPNDESYLLSKGFSQEDINEAKKYNNLPWVKPTAQDKIAKAFVAAGGDLLGGNTSEELDAILEKHPELAKMPVSYPKEKGNKAEISFSQFVSNFVEVRQNLPEYQSIKSKEARVAYLKDMASSEYMRLYGKGTTFVSQATDVAAFVFQPARVLKPEVKASDIKTLEWVVGGTQIAILAMPFVNAPIRAGISGVAGGIFSYSTAKEWKNMSNAQRALAVGFDVLVLVPFLNAVIKKVKYTSVNVPTKGGEVTVWKGVAVADRPLIGKSGGELTVGGRNITGPEFNTIAEGYKPELALDTRIMAARKNLVKMGASKSEIVKIEETIRTRNSFMGEKSPYTPSKIEPEPIKSLDAEGVKTVLNQANEYGDKVGQVYGSSTIKPQLRPDLKNWRQPADIDIQTKLNEIETKQFTDELVVKLKKSQGVNNVRVSAKTPTLIEVYRDGEWHHAVDIHADETGRTLGQIFDFRNTKIGSFVNSKINRALNSTYNVQTEKAFLKRLNKVRTAQIKMEMAAGESKFAPFDVVGQDGIVRTIKFDAPAKQSRWRAILTGPSEKPYLYYTPKGEEEYLLRTGFRVREMAPVGTTKTGAAFKTGGGLSQIEPTWELGTNYKGATKSAGLALEERLGAMTPEQAAKIRGVVYPLVARGIPLVEVLNDPLVQEKIEPVIRQSEVTKPGTGTRTGTQIYTTTSPITSPAQKTASKTSTAPGTTQKTGTISDVRTGTAADTGLETASETQTQVQTATITDTATKTATQTAETGRPAAGRPPVYYGWKKKKLSELTEEEKEGAIAWKQGFGWWVIIPPLYDEETAIYSLKPPSKYGIRVAPNMKSAFSTIQQTEGKVPDVISFNRLGIVKATITRPPRQPGARTGAIKFTQTSKANQRLRNKKVGRYYVAGRMVSRHPIGR